VISSLGLNWFSVHSEIVSCKDAFIRVWLFSKAVRPPFLQTRLEVEGAERELVRTLEHLSEGIVRLFECLKSLVRLVDLERVLLEIEGRLGI